MRDGRFAGFVRAYTGQCLLDGRHRDHVISDETRIDGIPSPPRVLSGTM